MSKRYWTAEEEAFYRKHARNNCLLGDTIDEAVSAKLPRRTHKQVKSHFGNTSESWTGMGGASALTTRIALKNIPDKKPISTSEKVVYDKQIQTLKSQNAEVLSKYKSVLQQVGRKEYISALISEACTRLSNDTLEIGKFNPPKRENKGVIDETMVMILSDLHAGEAVSVTDTMGFGKYDEVLFQRRMEYYVDIVKLYARDILSNYRYRKLHIFCLGDMITGLIHEELMQYQTLSLVESVILCVKVMERVILDLLDTFETIELDCVVGNHGRLKQQYVHKKRAIDNFDFICYKMLEASFASEKRVKFVIADAPHLIVDVEGWKWFLTHGDNIKCFNGIPYYGVMREIKKWGDLMSAQNSAFDYVCLGHFHTAYTFSRANNGKVFGNGSLIGPTEYSLDGSFDPACASQWLLGVHKEIGVTLQIDVYLQDPKVKEDYRYNFTVKKNNQKT